MPSTRRPPRASTYIYARRSVSALLRGTYGTRLQLTARASGALRRGWTCRSARAPQSPRTRGTAARPAAMHLRGRVRLPIGQSAFPGLEPKETKRAHTSSLFTSANFRLRALTISLCKQRILTSNSRGRRAPSTGPLCSTGPYSKVSSTIPVIFPSRALTGGGTPVPNGR